MIFAGLVPPYIDIYRERRVRGFSFIFLAIDMGGALFSLLSLCMYPLFVCIINVIVFEPFDPLAAVIYIVLRTAYKF
jgi:PQ loop repeat